MGGTLVSDIGLQRSVKQPDILSVLTPQHHHKIDPSREYPCPCNKGKLLPITLTEALGCDRCRRIFTIQADGYAIEELADNYPYKRRYVWTGKSWQSLHSFPNTSLWALLRPRNRLGWWLQSIGTLAIAIALFRLFYPAMIASQILNLVSSVAIVIFLAIAIVFWLFSQG